MPQTVIDERPLHSMATSIQQGGIADEGSHAAGDHHRRTATWFAAVQGEQGMKPGRSTRHHACLVFGGFLGVHKPAHHNAGPIPHTFGVNVANLNFRGSRRPLLTRIDQPGDYVGNFSNDISALLNEQDRAGIRQRAQVDNRGRAPGVKENLEFI